MNNFVRITMAAATMSMLAALAFSTPSFAQTAGTGSGSGTGTGSSTFDAFASGGDGYTDGTNASKAPTGSQAINDNQLMQAPKLQGATNGTIGPQMEDATYVTGVNTAGTVRVNNLANLEALLNIMANGMEILGIAWGGPTMIMGFMHMAAGTQDSMKRVLFGIAGVTGGMATPGCINWLVASARDANLFS
jgi:hypothetical protein